MLTVTEALKKIGGTIKALGDESVPLSEAVDRVLARNIKSLVDLPPFPNSAMDGYAVKWRDVANASECSPVQLRLRDKIRAGQTASSALNSNEASMIMTGALIPRGADAVVMKEFTHVNGKGQVKILRRVVKTENIRPQGEDVKAGEIILKAGTRIRPYEVALLASQGIALVSVLKKPVVGVLTTGDEILPLRSTLRPGKIRNSNGPALLATLQHWDIESVDYGISRDNPAHLTLKIDRALQKVDVLLVTGGVSVGDFDFTKEVLERLGVREVFWKVAIKPGKPLFFGVKNKKYVFGLPGNPVSALVCMDEFVRPALEKLQGIAPSHPSYHLAAKAVNSYPLPVGRRQYLFCEVGRKKDEFEIKIIRPQGSAMMGMASRANALALSSEGSRRVQAGDVLQFRWLK